MDAYGAGGVSVDRMMIKAIFLLVWAFLMIADIDFGEMVN